MKKRIIKLRHALLLAIIFFCIYVLAYPVALYAAGSVSVRHYVFLFYAPLHGVMDRFPIIEKEMDTWSFMVLPANSGEPARMKTYRKMMSIYGLGQEAPEDIIHE